MSTKRLSPILEKKHGSVTFALFLRAARESLGLTQTEMAQKLGLAKGTLCDVEKGRQLVSVTLAKKIAVKPTEWRIISFDPTVFQSQEMAIRMELAMRLVEACGGDFELVRAEIARLEQFAKKIKGA